MLGRREARGGTGGGGRAIRSAVAHTTSLGLPIAGLVPWFLAHPPAR